MRNPSEMNRKSCDDWRVKICGGNTCHEECLDCMRAEIERLAAYPKAVDEIKAYYPTDVFPDGEGSVAKFARSLCEQIHHKAAEITAAAQAAEEK